MHELLVQWVGYGVPWIEAPGIVVVLWGVHRVFRDWPGSLAVRLWDGETLHFGEPHRVLSSPGIVADAGPGFRFPVRHGKAADRAAIAFHYDVSNDFYRLWLDAQMVYSCAYFEEADDGLDQAQRNKLEHLCRKLRLQPGERLLDIGYGWGALIRWAAVHYGVSAHGITLSRNQYEHCRRMIAAEGLQDRFSVDRTILSHRYGMCIGRLPSAYTIQSGLGRSIWTRARWGSGRKARRASRYGRFAKIMRFEAGVEEVIWRRSNNSRFLLVAALPAVAEAGSDECSAEGQRWASCCRRHFAHSAGMASSG